MTGAGIGILSTELGYYLADLIFKEKGINRLANEEVFSRMDKPSFLSLYLGLNIPLSGYDINEQTEFSTSSGSTAGVEGAYFFNPYIGAGGRFTVSNTSIIVNTDRAENNTFDVISFYGGSYFSYPFSSRWDDWQQTFGRLCALSVIATGRPSGHRKKRFQFRKRNFADVQGQSTLWNPLFPRL